MPVKSSSHWQSLLSHARYWSTVCARKEIAGFMNLHASLFPFPFTVVIVQQFHMLYLIYPIYSIPISSSTDNYSTANHTQTVPTQIITFRHLRCSCMLHIIQGCSSEADNCYHVASFCGCLSENDVTKTQREVNRKCTDDNNATDARNIKSYLNCMQIAI